MLKDWKLKDLITILVMAASLVAWGSRLESKLTYHESLPYHKEVPYLVDRRIGEKVALARAKDAAEMATLIAETKHLREEIISMRVDINKLREEGASRQLR